MSYPAFTRAIHVNLQLYAYARIYVVYNSGPLFKIADVCRGSI